MEGSSDSKTKLGSCEWKNDKTVETWKHTLVNEIVGKDTPKKNPNTILIKVVTISLIVSFGLLIIPLHKK